MHRAGIITAARVNLTHPHLVNSTITESTSQWFCSLFPLLKIFLCFSFSFTVHKSHQGYISIYKWKPESVLGHSVGKQLPTFFCLFVCFFQINNILHKKGKGLLADSMHIFAIPIPTLYLSIHPFIYPSIQPAMSLIWVQVTRQHYKQSPVFQPRGNTEAFPRWLRDIIFPSCPGSTLGHPHLVNLCYSTAGICLQRAYGEVA